MQHAGNSDTTRARRPLRETAVADVMTSTSVGSHPTAFNATGLPILRIALDVAAMTPVLEPLLAPLTSARGPARLTYAKLLAYKAGNRGTIRYDVVTDHSVTVLGKLYPAPGQVARVDGILRGLWDDVFAGSPDLGVPRPLGVVPELSMLVYVPVTGQPLDDRLIHGPAIDDVRRTAQWLAALHGSHLDLDRSLRMDTEMVNLHAWAALVAEAQPEHGDAARRLAEALGSSAEATVTTETTPIHKDFHYRHVLVDHGLWVIDFDEVRRGDPMYDVGHFCAHLRLLACRNPSGAAGIARSEGVFLDGYGEMSGRPLGRSFPWFAAYTCLKIAKQLCSLRGVRPHPDGGEKSAQLGVMLDQGMAFHDLLR